MAWRLLAAAVGTVDGAAVVAEVTTWTVVEPEGRAVTMVVPGAVPVGAAEVVELDMEKGAEDEGTTGADDVEFREVVGTTTTDDDEVVGATEVVTGAEEDLAGQLVTVGLHEVMVMVRVVVDVWVVVVSGCCAATTAAKRATRPAEYMFAVLAVVVVDLMSLMVVSDCLVSGGTARKAALSS